MPISVASPAKVRGLGAPLRAVVRTTLALADRTPGEIGIAFVRDPEMRALNRRWRRIDRATDVLSFGYDSDDPVLERDGVDHAAAITLATAGPSRRVHGDLVISLDRLVEQARRFRVSVGKELARLVVHGTLHLAGLDHARPVERRHMRRREQSALRACGRELPKLDRALAMLPAVVTGPGRPGRRSAGKAGPRG